MTTPVRETRVRVVAVVSPALLRTFRFTACSFLLLSAWWSWSAFQAFTEGGTEGDGWEDLLHCALCLALGLYTGREWRRLRPKGTATAGTSGARAPRMDQQ